MMNENVKKSYAELLEIRNGLMHADGDQEIINAYVDRLYECMLCLQTEDEYGKWVVTLVPALNRFVDGDNVVTLDYIITYVDKLAELIEVTNKPSCSDEAKAMCEEAKSVCEDIASTVQVGFQVAKETVKAVQKISKERFGKK